MSIKKPYQILLAVMMIFSLPFFDVQAADKVVITSDTIDNSAEGTQIVRVCSHGGSGVMGFRLHFEYSADKVRPVAAEKGSVTKDGKFTDNIGTNDGEFDILWNNSEEVSAEGELALISFEVLTANEPFIIDVDYEQEDTFNENWEDVIFECFPIYTLDNSEKESFEEDSDESVSASLVIAEAMKDSKSGELSESEKNDILDKVNSDIERNSGEKQHYSSYDEIRGDYAEYLLNRLTDEAENLETNLSAAQIISDVLKQRGETSVNEENADAITMRFEEEGLDGDYGEFIKKDDIIKKYSDILDDGGELIEPVSDSSKNKSADNLLYIAAASCIAAAAAVSGILLYYVRRRKNAQK